MYQLNDRSKQAERGGQKLHGVGPLVTYLKYWIYKVVCAQGVLPHLLLALLLTLSCFLVEVEQAGAAARNVAESHFASKRFLSTEIRGFPEWYGWMRDVVQSHSLSITGSACCTHPVVGLHVRQYRLDAKKGACSTNEGLANLLVEHRNRNRGLRSAWSGRTCLPSRFSLDVADFGGPLVGLPTNLTAPLPPLTANTAALWSASSVNAAGYGSLLSNISNATSSSWITLTTTAECRKTCPQLHGSRAEYVGEGVSTSFLLNVTDTAAALAVIEELEDHNWIQESTRAVTVEGFVHSTIKDQYIRSVFVAEISIGRSLQTDFVNQDSFKVPNVEFSFGIGLVVLDIALLLSVVLNAVCFVYRFIILVEINSTFRNAIYFGEFIDLCSLALVATLVVLRFISLGYSMSSAQLSAAVDERDLFLRLSVIASQQSLIRTIGGWALLTTFIRSIHTFRHMNRMSLIFETMAAASTDFVSVALITALILTAYSLTGNVLWYFIDAPFKNFWSGLFFLFNFMLSINVDLYDQYEEAHDIATALFFLSFFIVAWCVLMNVIISVLASAFATALQTQTFIRRPEWTLRSLLHDSASLWARYSDDEESYFPGRKDMPQLPEETNVLLRWGFQHFLRKGTVRAIVLVRTLRNFQRDGTTAFTVGTEAQKNARTQQMAEGTKLFNEITEAEVNSLSTFAPSETFRMLAKAELHVGISDVNKRRWLMMQKVIKGEKDVSAQLSAQYRQLQELVEVVCGNAVGEDLNNNEDDDDEADEQAAQLSTTNTPPKSQAASHEPVDNNSFDAASEELKEDAGDDDEDGHANSGAGEEENAHRRGGAASSALVSVERVLVQVHELQRHIDAVGDVLERRRRALQLVPLEELQQLADRYEQLCLDLGIVV